MPTGCPGAGRCGGIKGFNGATGGGASTIISGRWWISVISSTTSDQGSID